MRGTHKPVPIPRAARVARIEAGRRGTPRQRHRLRNSVSGPPEPRVCWSGVCFSHQENREHREARGLRSRALNARVAVSHVYRHCELDPPAGRATTNSSGEARVGLTPSNSVVAYEPLAPGNVDENSDQADFSDA